MTRTSFTKGATVVLGGTHLTKTFVSPTHLTAVIPAILVAQAGTVAVVDAFGGVTNAVALTIAVVKAVPPPQPTGSPASGTSPLPQARPSDSPIGGSPPAPLPQSRP